MVCRECGKTFYFSAAGQEFFQEQGFSEAPKRCRACREKRREERRSGNSQNGSGGRFPAICWSCQRHVMVPFKPAPGHPVYCRVCYGTQKRHGLA
jgi:CxxC-x17-CxxC domain-containing protein